MAMAVDVESVNKFATRDPNYELLRDSNGSSCVRIKQVFSAKRFSCSFCDKSFTKSSSVRKHCRKLHGINYIYVDNGGKLKCAFKSECDLTFHRTALYRAHLQLVHGIKIEKVIMRFTSFDEFLAWKAEEETATSSKFVKGGKAQGVYNSKAIEIQKLVYNCSRTGDHNIKGTKRRASLKMNACCPAKMDVIYSYDRVILVYFKTHVGHGELNEVFKTSERRRLTQAISRVRKKYNTTKDEVRNKIEKFLEDLNSDKFSIDYLNYISKKLDYVFDPSILTGESVVKNENEEILQIEESSTAVSSMVPEHDENVIVIKISPQHETECDADFLNESATEFETFESSPVQIMSSVEEPSSSSQRTDSFILDHCYDISSKLLLPKSEVSSLQNNSEHGQKSKFGEVLSVTHAVENTNSNSLNSYVLQNHFMDVLINDFTSMDWDNKNIMMHPKIKASTDLPKICSKPNKSSLQPASEEVKKKYDMLWESFRNK